MRIDPFFVALLLTVGLASLFPCRGEAATLLSHATDGGIALLFFLYGARLSRDAVVQGISHWRLQLFVFLATYGLFPLLGLALRAVLSRWMAPPLLVGLVFLTVLPSTVQSSIAFTSIARGNISAAICSASISNLIGVLLTPLLVQLLLEGSGAAPTSLRTVGKIALILLAPFVVGHLLRPFIGAWTARNQSWLGYLDRGSILLVVYSAFSEGVVAHVWSQLPLVELGALVVTCSLLLAAMMVALTWLSRRLGFSTEDEIAIVFCGSKKSMASGLPMAKVLFAGPAVSITVLPLMLFHQVQLMVCAAMARRYARRAPRAPVPETVTAPDESDGA